MRAILLTTLCLVFWDYSHGQTRFSFGVQAQVGFTNAVEITERNVPFGRIEGHRTLSVPVVGGGLWLAYPLTKRVSMHLGLQYLNTGNVYLIEGQLEDRLTGERSFTFEQRNQFRAHQIQVPFELQLRLGNGRLRPTLSLGLQGTRDYIVDVWSLRKFVDTGPVTECLQKHEADRRSRDKLASYYIQPIASIGVHLNDYLSLQLRRTWIKEVENLNWGGTNPAVEINTSSLFLDNCLHYHHDSLQSSHRAITSLAFSYAFH